MSSRYRSIALFLPAHNEAENLPIVVGEAVAYLADHTLNYTVIIVNDGSVDNTAEVCDGLCKVFGPRLTVITHEVNRGYGAALRSGFKAGLETGHDWVGFLDADRQFQPHQVGHLIDEAVKHEADVAVGYRVERKDNLLRRLMGKQWHCLSQVVLGFSAIDVDCGFKVFSRPVLEEISPHLIGNSASISPELFARVQRCGFKICEAPVHHQPRLHGESSGGNLRVIRRSFHSLVQVHRALNGKAPRGNS